jgi:hypothetical protein
MKMYLLEKRKETRVRLSALTKEDKEGNAKLQSVKKANLFFESIYPANFIFSLCSSSPTSCLVVFCLVRATSCLVLSCLVRACLVFSSSSYVTSSCLYFDLLCIFFFLLLLLICLVLRCLSTRLHSLDPVLAYKSDLSLSSHSPNV